SVGVKRLFDDGELRYHVYERRETGCAPESIRRRHRVLEASNRRVCRNGPHACPHLRRLARVLGCRESSLASPPHRYIDRCAAINEMNDEHGGVLNIAASSIDRRHAEPDTLPALEATGEHAVGCECWRVIEACNVSPDNELASRMSRLWIRR